MSERKANLVNLNIGLTGRDKPPEEDVATMFIDGTPIHNVLALSVHAAHDGMTQINIVFNAKVGGFDQVKVNS